MASAKHVMGRLLVGGLAIFLLTAEAAMPTPMPGDAAPVGDHEVIPNGLVCSDGMEMNPYNDADMVIETADATCAVIQTPIHT